MRASSSIALAAAAAAVLVPLAPSYAAGARPCEAGYVGVVMFDANGDVARACVRDPGIQDLRDYPGELAAWATEVPRCWSTPEGIACERKDPPPRP